MTIKLKEIIENPKILKKLDIKNPICSVCEEEIEEMDEARKRNKKWVCVDCWYNEEDSDSHFSDKIKIVETCINSLEKELEKMKKEIAGIKSELEKEKKNGKTKNSSGRSN